MPLQQCCDTYPSTEFPAFFCFPSLRRPMGKVGAVWGRMGKSSPKLHRNFIGLYLHAPQVALPYALADTYSTHARHMPDTCSTHVGQAGAVWEMHDGVENGYDCDSLQDKGATRIKAQHGQSKREDNYSCHNPKTMQYSCHNPKR